jgi:hypothetical protein
MKDPLHQKFVELGRERNRITYKLLSLLPEIFKRRIYEKEGYVSIYEYAGKLAGLSYGVVEKTLSTVKNLEGKPSLQKAVETQGIHKVALVAKLASPETDAAWADKVNNMSKNALAELAKEVRAKKGEIDSLCQAAPTPIKIELDKEMQFMFLKLKKQIGDYLSNKETMRRILKTMTGENFAEEKNPRGRIRAKNIENDKGAEMTNDSAIMRYIPAKEKRAALSKSKEKCAYPHYNRPADLLHHRERFHEKRSHKSIIPLCKAHHEFAHNGLIANESKDQQNWRLKIDEGVLTHSDALFRSYRL